MSIYSFLHMAPEEVLNLKHILKINKHLCRSYKSMATVAKLSRCSSIFRKFIVNSTRIREAYVQNKHKFLLNQMYTSNRYAKLGMTLGSNGFVRCALSTGFTSVTIGFSLFSFSDDLSELKDKLSKEDPVILTLKYAKLSEDKHEYKEANGYYHNALSLLKTYEQTKSWDESKILQAKIYTYDRMANLALARGRYEEAEKLFKETMRGLLQTHIEKDSNAIMEISLKLSMIYSMQQKYVEAERGYKFCIETQENKIKSLRDDRSEIDEDTVGILGMCLNSYARFLFLRDRLVEAEECFEKCLKIAKETFGEIHPQVAVLLSDIASMQSAMHKYDHAYSSIQKAIYIGRKTNSDDLSQFYYNAGEILISMSKYSEAKKSCEKASRLAKKADLTNIMKEASACIEHANSKLG